jgi:phosphomethylpyrimidine synthase
MARARVALDLDRQIGLSIDPEKLGANRENGNGGHCCAVCGPQCAAQVAAKYFGIA